jgi:hypothetical protein
VYGDGVPKPVSNFEEASFPGDHAVLQLAGLLCSSCYSNCKH